jgi:DNA-binding MarR family transcriptional regulator
MTDSEIDTAVAALRELILAGERYRLVVAHHLGVTVSESQALSYLLARGPMGQTDLGNALHFTTGSTTSLVDRLERRRFVERVPDPQDRRRNTVQLSEQGHKHIGEASNWMFLAFTDIDPEHRHSLAESLHTLADGLRRLPADDATPSVEHTKPRRTR